MKSKDVEATLNIQRAANALTRQIKSIIIRKNDLSSNDSNSNDFDRLELGLILRHAGSTWRTALLICYADYILNIILLQVLQSPQRQNRLISSSFFTKIPTNVHYTQSLLSKQNVSVIPTKESYLYQYTTAQLSSIANLMIGKSGISHIPEVAKDSVSESTSLLNDLELSETAISDINLVTSITEELLEMVR